MKELCQVLPNSKCEWRVEVRFALTNSCSVSQDSSVAKVSLLFIDLVLSCILVVAPFSVADVGIDCVITLFSITIKKCPSKIARLFRKCTDCTLNRVGDLVIKLKLDHVFGPLRTQFDVTCSVYMHKRVPVVVFLLVQDQSLDFSHSVIDRVSCQFFVLNQNGLVKDTVSSKVFFIGLTVTIKTLE